MRAKAICLAAYAAAIILVWTHREVGYQHLAMFRATPLGDIPLDLLFAALALVGALAIIRPYSLTDTRNLFRRAGLHNGKGEYPSIVAVRRDKYKQHGRIYVIRNCGVSVPEFDAAVCKLEAAFDGKIYAIEYGRDTSRTLLYVLPRKYAQPMIISQETRQLCEVPNCLVVGATGSGKSYALAVLLSIYTRYIPDVSITVCDFKKSSFAYLADTPNFYGYEAVPEGIRQFYREFSERLAANDEQRNRQIRVLLIDEYSAMLNALDKKETEAVKRMVGNMLFMGRSLGIRVLIGVQRADAEHFQAGARDQFHAILGLGNLSREQKQMLFPDYKDQMNDRNGLGEGYLLLDGHAIERVRVAAIQDMDGINANIRKAMCR